MTDPVIGSLVVRADASTRIGTGHVMRCLALAQRWMGDGGTVVFVGDCGSESLRRRIGSTGAELVPVPACHPHPADLHTLCEVAERAGRRHQGRRPAWVAVDGYGFGPEYQRAVQSAGLRLLVIDDMAHHDRYHADVLLNQNAGAEALRYAYSDATVRLLGPRYALLRPEFLRWSRWQRRVPAAATRLLISLGGSDPDNAALSVVRAVGELSDVELEVRLVVGAASPHRAALEAAIEQVGPDRLRLLVQVNDMPEQMAWADLAVSAGGSTCWELAYMGVPNLILVLAENQQRIAAALDEAGASIDLGWHAGVQPSSLARMLGDLVHDPARRQEMSERGRALVDGQGAERVVDVLRSTGSSWDAHTLPRQ